MKISVLERLAKSLIVLGKVVVGEMMTADSPPFHQHLDRYLRDLKERLIVVIAPRGTAKSSVTACLFVLWHLFLEKHYRRMLGLPDAPGGRFVVIISKTANEAKKRLDTIKAVLESTAFRKVFGNYGEDTASTWTQAEVVLKGGHVILAMGTGQQSRGLKRVHRRVTLVVADDPEDELNTRTEEAMIFNVRWLLQAVLPSLDETIGRCVVIGTPINTQCMVVRLKDTEGWRALWYKQDAEKNRSYWYDSATREWMEFEGVLWPEYQTKAKLLAKKAMAFDMGMVSSYYREHEAVIVGDEDQIFRPEYIQTWYGDWGVGKAPWLRLRRVNGKEIPEQAREKIPVLMFVGVDPASSVSETADRTVICNIAVDAEKNIYVMPSIHKRMHPDEVVDAVARNHREIQPYRGAIETSAAFEFVWTYLHRDHGIRYIREKPRTKKKGEGSRLESMQPKFKRGKIFIWEMSDTLAPLKSQLLSYPRGKDDFLDALHKAIKYARRPTHEVIPDGDSMENEDGPPPKYYDPLLA